MNDVSVETRLAEIEALLAAATPETWTDMAESQGQALGWHTITTPRRVILSALITPGDAALITRAPRSLRFLLEEVAKMRTWAERAAADENATTGDADQARARAARLALDLQRAQADLAQARADLTDYERVDAALRRTLMAEAGEAWTPSAHIEDSAPCWADVVEATRAAGVRAMRDRVRRFGVYVVSPDTAEYRATWQDLRVRGLPITSTWIDPVEPSLAERRRRISAEITASAALIVHDTVLQADAFVEIGMALALGLRVFVAVPGVEGLAFGTWIWSPNVTICADLEDAVHQVDSLLTAWRPGLGAKLVEFTRETLDALPVGSYFSQGEMSVIGVRKTPKGWQFDGASDVHDAATLLSTGYDLTRMLIHVGSEAV